MSHKYSLFEVFGIESEYMIVDQETLKVSPIADKVLTELAGGENVNFVEIGDVAWSNELVNHVIELKCKDPVHTLDGLDEIFHHAVIEMNKVLEKYRCILMPSAMHPWFSPEKETVLWPHGQKEIYSVYDKIFDCRGHGWSNLQSVHINLPYTTEEEFKKLHSSIRAVLPIIPLLCASSPFYNGKKGESLDNRLAFYEKNQKKVPSIAGNIIPESVSSFKDYANILRQVYKDVSQYEDAQVIQRPWLNSRGAIVKFDVRAIEIRIMDIQESPYMDISLAYFIVELVREIANSSSKLEIAQNLGDKELRGIYEQAKEGRLGENEKFFTLFDVEVGSDFIHSLIEKKLHRIPQYYQKGILTIKERGCLSKRLLNKELSHQMYQSLVNCLKENTIYE